jgi:hypothetical protein
MTDADRIKRLETAVERLCALIYRIDSRDPLYGVKFECDLISQYVQGKLDPAVQGTARYTLDG